MPLASNATKPHKKSQPPLATNINSNNDSDRRRRESIRSSIGASSTSTTGTSTKHRLSLPKSLPSSTVVTKQKVERRRSLLRITAKENHPTNDDTTTTTPNRKRKHDQVENDHHHHHDDSTTTNEEYSPPRTRSASKLRLQKQPRITTTQNPNFFSNQQNALLQFSPPDHLLNAQRERDRLRIKEEERAARIAEARRNGQLLMISSDAAEYSMDGNTDSSSQAKDVSIANDNGTDGKEAAIDKDLIKKMSDEVTRLAQYQMEAKHERRTSDAQLLQKVQEMMTNEKEKASSEQSLTALQSTNRVLEQNNAKLMEEMKLLNATFLHETESHTIHTTQLEMKLQQAHETIVTLEASQSELREQLVTLESEKDHAISESERLQTELRQTLSQLESTRQQVVDMEQSMNHDNLDYSEQLKQLQIANNELQSIVETENKSYTKLQNVVQSKEDAIRQLESEMIPNLQSTIEMERDHVARLEQALESRQQEIDQANNDIDRLQKELQTLQYQYQEVHENSLILDRDHERMVNELQSALSETKEKFSTTNEQMALEIYQLTETSVALQNSNDSFITQQKQLNDALEESMIQLDQTEKEKRTIDQKLQQAYQQIDAIQKSLSLSNSETSEMIQHLTEQVNTERQLREETEQIRSELDTIVREQKNVIVTLQQQVQVTTHERNVARNNMDGYNVREQKLYDQLQYYEHVRREMHSKLMQLMGNIRVFVRIRPKLPHEEPQNNNNNCQTRPDDTDVTAKKKLRLSMQEKPKRKERENNGNEGIFRYPGMYDGSPAVEDGNHKGLPVTAMSLSGTGTTGNSSSSDATKNIIEVTAPYKDRGGLNDRRKQWTFGFDRVFTPTHTQNDIWDATDPLIQCAIDGYHVTIFAYGQTGSGKTFTMLGEEGINEGIIGRTVRKLFDEKQKIIDLSRGESNITMFVELLEIYNEKVRDLLSSGKEELKLTSNEVVGNILVETNTVDEVLQVLKLAQGRRCVKATNSNSESSRSHMIFTIHFKVTMSDGNTIRNGKVNICDLAGSERLDKSGANIVGGALLEETKNINKSLSVLSNVIERLQAGDTKNVPFRESKLTYLLKDSLSGNSKTLAIICCNPLASHINESLCSLRFAEKVNRVDLKAVANFSC